jgi:subtilisin family serine protease
MRKVSLLPAITVAALGIGLPLAIAQNPSPAGLPIRLKAATFDPIRGEPTLAAALRHQGLQATERGIYIVQFTGPIEDSWKGAVAAAGGELLEYVPDFAFKVRMKPAQALAVRRLSRVRWVGLFHPAYKLSPRLVRAGERPYVVRIEAGSDPALVEASIGGTGARVVKRDGRALLVVATTERLEALARLEDVAWVENFVLRRKHNDKGGGVIMGSATANGFGYDGSTQTVAIADTGIGGGTAATAHAHIPASRISAINNWPGATDFCFESIVNDGSRDVDTGHGTHVAVSVLGDGGASGLGRGTAPAAHLLFQSIENYATTSLLCELLYGIPSGYYLTGIPTNIGDLFQQAYTGGARIHSNSWGSASAGQYTADSQNTDAFVWAHRDMTVTFSAGNAGADANSDGIIDDDSIDAPATAKNVISVGASENDRDLDYPCDATKYAVCAARGGQNHIFTWWENWPFSFPAEPLKSDPSAGNAEQVAAFSSRGPTDDGRIKPDVVAPGSWVLSGYSDLYQDGYDTLPNPQDGLFQYAGWGYPLNDKLKYLGGTSMANPLVAGGAAVVRDYYQKVHGRSASAALVKATLVNSAHDLLDENNDGIDDNHAPIPNTSEGWGRVDLAAATDGSREFTDDAAGLPTGGFASYSYDIAGGTPLKVTIAWSDYPGNPSATKMLVNNLDLEVTGPGGAFYRGNVFAGGWSVAGGGADSTNNVENVYVESPAAGLWTVTVRGFNVPQGPQPYAVVVGGLVAPGPPVEHELTVTPPANGTVTSLDGFITCGTGGAACSHLYAGGSSVNLGVTPDTGFALAGWTGDCVGAGASCHLSMNQARTAGASFGPNPVVLSIGDASVVEGNAGTTSVVLTVSLSGVTSVPVSVSYATADTTATAGSDYVAASGSLSFAPGVTSRTIGITVNGDTTVETDETLLVNLSGPVFATIADGQGVATVRNDDVVPSPGPQPVVWTALDGVSASGSSLTKTSASGVNSGAISVQQIPSGDGYVEVTASETNTYRMFGFSNGNTDSSYQDIDFGLDLAPGTIYVFEKGVNKGNFGSYATGDLLRVAVVGGVVRYSRNGAVFYTSTQAPTYPLLVDTWLYHLGATLNNAVIAVTVAAPPPPPPPSGGAPVVWTALDGVSASGSSLTKTSASGVNSGAISVQQIPSGDGYVELTASENSTYRMFGLSNGNTDSSYQDIDFGLDLAPGTIYVFEKGVNKGNFGSYATGDLLRVAVVGGVVRYSRNGTVFYTSAQAPTYPLLVDTWLYSLGATLNNAVVAVP